MGSDDKKQAEKGAEKPLVAVEFDGVLHSGERLRQSPRDIPGEAVPGALQWLVETVRRRKVVVHSWRSLYLGGRWAMKRWLHKQLRACAGESWRSTPRWLQDLVAETAFADPWEDEVRWAAKRFVRRRLGWPRHWPDLADARWVTTELVLLSGLPKFE